MDDEGVMTISEIEMALSKAVQKWPGGIDAILETVLKQVVGNKSSFDIVGDHAFEPWFVPEEIRQVTSTSLDRARHMMMQAEVHLQCASHYVKFMMDQELFKVGALPARKGPRPETRVATSWTTMVCNHEIVTFALLRGHNPRVTHNSGMTLSHRYYFTDNSAAPFLKHEAKIMAGLGLWRILEPSGDIREYRCSEGPYLVAYMEKVYWPALEWALQQVSKALVGARKIP